MRKQIFSKQILFLSMLSLAAFPLQGWSLAQLEPGASTALSKLMGAKVVCTSPDPACLACEKVLGGVQNKTKSAVEAAIKEDAASTGAGAGGAALAGASEKAAAEGLIRDAGGGAGAGGAGAGGRSGAAAKAAAAFKQCESELSVCESVPSGKPALDACKAGAASAGAAAADQGKAAGEMGGMADALSKAAGMLGPLMEAMKGKEEPPKTSNITPPKVAEKPQQIAGTSLAGSGKEGVKGITIGNSDPGKNAVDPVEGGAPVNMSGFAATPDIDSSLGGETLDNGTGGGPSIASVAPSGGGGTGSTNSSGASMMGEVPSADAAKVGVPDGFGEYSLAGGGGGSRPSFLGLKGKGEEGSGEEVAEENPLEALGVEEEGERSLASEDPGIHQDQSGNLFSVIHSKYKEIKLKGNI